MQGELSNLHRELGLTFVMVTHDQEEALSLSDRIAVMNQGIIEQIDTPENIYQQPKTPFVADFIGDTNLFHGKIEGFYPTMLWVVTETGLKVKARQPQTGSTLTSGMVVLSVRPETIQISLTPANDERNCFEGRLRDVMYLGTHVHYHIELLSGDRLTVMRPNTPTNLPTADTPIYASWTPQDCLALAL